MPDEPAAQNIHRRREFGRQVGAGSFTAAAGAEIFGLAIDPEDRNDLDIVERFEPLTDAPIDPRRVIAIANFCDCLRHGRDTLQVP